MFRHFERYCGLMDCVLMVRDGEGNRTAGEHLRLQLESLFCCFQLGVILLTGETDHSRALLHFLLYKINPNLGTVPRDRTLELETKCTFWHVLFFFLISLKKNFMKAFSIQTAAAVARKRSYIQLILTTSRYLRT